MPIFNAVFNEGDVIESHRLNELLKARKDNGQLCDFFCVGPGADSQKKLKKWRDWFTLSAVMIQSMVNFAYDKISVPWAITLTKGNYVLWKIDETIDENEIAKVRNDPNVRWFSDAEE